MSLHLIAIDDHLKLFQFILMSKTKDIIEAKLIVLILIKLTSTIFVLTTLLQELKSNRRQFIAYFFVTSASGILNSNRPQAQIFRIKQ